MHFFQGVADVNMSSDEEPEGSQQSNSKQESQNSNITKQTIITTNFNQSMCFDWLSSFVKENYKQ